MLSPISIVTLTAVPLTFTILRLAAFAARLRHGGGDTNVTGVPLATLVTAVPFPAAASLTGAPIFGNVAVTSVTGMPPLATVLTGVAMVRSS